MDGWDFSWLDGRATEKRPSWGYQRLLGERLASASAAVDLQTGGTYFAQHVGPASVVELAEFFLGPRPQADTERHPDDESAEAKAAGLQVIDARLERLRMEFFDVGAVVHFLRKVIWIVPGFTAERYRDRLRELHERIESEGRLVAHSS